MRYLKFRRCGYQHPLVGPWTHSRFDEIGMGVRGKVKITPGHAPANLQFTGYPIWTTIEQMSQTLTVAIGLLRIHAKQTWLLRCTLYRPQRSTKAPPEAMSPTTGRTICRRLMAGRTYHKNHHCAHNIIVMLHRDPYSISGPFPPNLLHPRPTRVLLGEAKLAMAASRVRQLLYLDPPSTLPSAV